MATAPISRTASVPPPIPASPRQPSTVHAAVAGSKIPRRRTSTSQSVDLSNANSVETDARVYPTSVPSSPDKRGTGATGHARKPSRTQFLPPPPPSSSTTNAAPLIERRRSSASANDGSGTSTRPRTPSLSIQIPVASSSSSSSQSQLQARPHVRLPDPHQRHGATHHLDSTAHRPARRMGHSRNASRESAPLSPLKASSAGPRASLRRCSAPVHSLTGHDSASNATAPFPRVPRTPYPFSPPASGSTPLSARSHRPPMLERTLSDSTMATYTSFDLQHPRTPEEEDGEGVRRGGGGECGGSRMRRWLSFWGSARRGESDVEAALESSSKQAKARSQLAAVDETTALLGGGGGDTSAVRQQTRWEYVWGEIVCYAKHMLPPIIVFVVVVLVIALLAYRQGIRRIAHPPHD